MSRQLDSVFPAENRSRAAAPGDVLVQVKLTLFDDADFVAYSTLTDTRLESGVRRRMKAEG